MNKIEENNYNLLLNSITYESVDPFVKEFIMFMNKPKELQKSSDLVTKIDEENNIYKINILGSDYCFKRLSDTELLPQSLREKIDNKTTEPGLDIGRILRLGTSSKLNDAKVLMGYLEELYPVVSFYYQEKEYIIDYFLNLIMSKDNYFKLFKFHPLNELTPYQIHLYNELLIEYDFYFPLQYFFLYASDLFESLKNIDSFFSDKNEYSNCGLNYKNSLLYNDHIFFCAKDKIKRPKMIEIEEYTIERKETNHIKEIDEAIVYKDGESEYSFFLYSDLFSDETIEGELLSEKRYHKCHECSWKYILYIIATYPNYNIKIIGGKVKANDIDYYYHTWIEIETNSKVLVFDYTKNLIMKDSKYYELVGAEKISEITKDDIVELLEYIKLSDLAFPTNHLSYFGKELLKDFSKNKNIFKR